MGKELVISVDSLSKSYGHVRALDKVTFNVVEGTLYGLLGPNGAGKSTLIRILLSLLTPDDGSYELFGLNPAEHYHEIYSRIGYVPESPHLPEFMSGEQFLIFTGRVYGLDKRYARKRALELLHLVGLEDAAGKKIKGYSKGMIQRLAIAHALLPGPDLLILDEPTIGMDPEGRVYFRNLFKRLVKEGTTIFLSSHMLEEVEKICTDVAIINKGKIILKGPIDHILTQFVDNWVIEIELTKPIKNLEKGLKKIKLIKDVKIKEKKIRIVLDEKIDVRKEISETIHDMGGVIIEMKLVKKSLEEVYLNALHKNP